MSCFIIGEERRLLRIQINGKSLYWRIFTSVSECQVHFPTPEPSPVTFSLRLVESLPGQPTFLSCTQYNILTWYWVDVNEILQQRGSIIEKNIYSSYCLIL
jgi:hypothetical protein